MKGKITIVLLSLVLVFGMIAASCDGGALPKEDTEDKNGKTLVYYESDVYGLPVVDDDGNAKLLDGETAYSMLQAKIAYTQTSNTSGSYTFTNKYEAATVAVKGKYNGVASADCDEGKLAKRYTGLPILVLTRELYTDDSETGMMDKLKDGITLK